jgi:hypothetical protein
MTIAATAATAATAAAASRGFLRPGVGPKWQRPAPEPYLAKFRHLAQAKNVSESTVEVRPAAAQPPDPARASCTLLSASVPPRSALL